MAVPQRRKLIEVALPLEKINAEAAREKSIRHGHPSTLHLWWARRPLAAARAVLFAQLVDDPSSHPDRFPDEESVRVERKRLHDLIERLVVWENSNNAELLAEAHAEIMKSTDNNPPPILDPFCGGGTIPLEAQRLGLEAHASDLNPVAVLITKALIEIPPKFAGRPPVFPGLAESRIGGWKGAEGLAADVRAYGQWMRDEAERRIGHLYPKATLPDGTKATVIAWIWARTVICPNPACGIEMPLVRSWWLGKKPGKEAYVEPYLIRDPNAPGGRRVQFSISQDTIGAPTPDTDGTVGRTGATCVACQSTVELKYVRGEGRRRRMGARLMAVVAEGNRRRLYIPATAEHEQGAQVDRPPDVPEGDTSDHSQYMGAHRYGMTEWVDLFSPRQLLALTTLSDLVVETRAVVRAHALASDLGDGESLDAGGAGAAAYADALATYLGLGCSKAADYHSALCSWRSDPKNEGVGHVFARQAIPMIWDFAEAAPFSASSGNFADQFTWISKVLERISPAAHGMANQANASTIEMQGLISTDPPYYDNVPYADLSDFFYVWLRRSLRAVHPRLLATMLVPKSDELVANALRQGSQTDAAKFFEEGFTRVFARARKSALADFPIAVFYAFKQTQIAHDGKTSTGWETLLEGILESGWVIVGTWPMRSELGNRMRSQGSNALASSVVLALRPRLAEAPSTDRRGFITALRAELPERLRELEQGRISPVDLPQAAIGPGMAVFSRYASVVEGDGSPMRVRAALAHINEVLGEVQAEQEGDFDATTRFAIAWFRQHGYQAGGFGDGDSMARARATAVEAIARTGILTSGGGKVALIRPGDLPATYDVERDEQISGWEVLHHTIRLLETEGIVAAGHLIAQVESRSDSSVDVDLVKELAFLLFAVAEDNRWTKEAVAFNGVATAWPDILAAARERATSHEQAGFDFDGSDAPTDGAS